MSPAKTCSEIFTASLHLIEVLAATTTTASARCAGLGPSLSPILRPVWGLDSRVRLSRGPLLRGPRARVRKVVRSSTREVTRAQRSDRADVTASSAPQDGVSSGAVAGNPVLYSIDYIKWGLSKGAQGGPARGGVLLQPARGELIKGGVNFYAAFRGSVRAWRSHSGLAQRSAATPAAAAARTPTVVAAAASIGATGFGVGAFVYSLPWPGP